MMKITFAFLLLAVSIASTAELPGLLDAQPGGLRLAGGAADRRKEYRRRAEQITKAKSGGRRGSGGKGLSGVDGENQRFQGLDEKENDAEGKEVWKRTSAEEHGSSSGGKRGGGFYYQQDVSLKCCRDLIFVFSLSCVTNLIN